MERAADRSADDPANERVSSPAAAPDRRRSALEQVRSFHHDAYPAARIASARARAGARVSVCLPARECARTVGEIVRTLGYLVEAGAIDDVVVVDAASRDGTAAVARAAGAEVWQQDDLMSDLGPVLGKGDAMWRALARLPGDLVCFLDADTEGFAAHFATGLLGPLLCEPDVAFVKGFYRRPLAAGGDLAEGGGRVNHLVARPALALFYPQLASVRQPLAGEVAARRELLETIPFATGYGVEIAMLIDASRAVGLGAIAQVDLDEHRNPHKALSELAPMALTVLATIARRVEADGRLSGGQTAHAPLERPPLLELARGADDAIAPGASDGSLRAGTAIAEGRG
jgi:glucosyl-3-phosphoglycerate synthase